MYAKICLAALAAVVATIASAQPLRVCQPACGAQYSDQNIYISTCCQQYEASVGANFDACCASSCANGNPCKWEDLGSASSP
ncbi:hypothetical protein P3T76_014740 [Phytophthora citrophthora]|uniref:Phytotoxin PcF domain-containing protein n=1 Tax=Phytophthora citrophthora TaxID=4793 RepID=A0AAD9LAV0_9STRA|nr:hypothetical protein P3T76_014740 [Phytophthora citrophthora]